MAMNLDAELTRLALQLYDCGAVRDKYRTYMTPPTVTERADGQRGFRLKLHEDDPDAPLSPVYLMIRTPENPTKPGQLSEEIVHLTGDIMGAHAFQRGLRFNAVVGLPYAGEPFAEAFPRINWYSGQGIKKLRLRKETNGERRKVVGPPEPAHIVQPGETVLVIDDLITHADTKLEGIAALEEAGLKVTDVLVVVDRQRNGTQELVRQGYTLHALFTIRDLLDIYVQHQRISPELQQETVAYLDAH